MLQGRVARAARATVGGGSTVWSFRAQGVENVSLRQHEKGQNMSMKEVVMHMKACLSDDEVEDQLFARQQ